MLVGRKRHVLTGTLSLLLAVTVRSAGVQARDGAEPLLLQPRKPFPSVERIIGNAAVRDRGWLPPSPAPAGGG
jgi:hypothetical protein